MCDFLKQIESAKEEIAKWTPEKKSYVQLEGTDRYLHLQFGSNKDTHSTQKHTPSSKSNY